MKRHAGLGAVAVIVLASVGTALSSRQIHTSSTGEFVPTAIVRHEAKYLRAELGHPTVFGRTMKGTRELRWREFDPEVPQSQDGEGHLVWRSAAFEDPGNMSCAPTSTGEWALVASTGEALWCWTSERAPWLPGVDEDQFARPTLDELKSPDSPQRLPPFLDRGIDIWSLNKIGEVILLDSREQGTVETVHFSYFKTPPIPFSWRGTLYVVSTGVRTGQKNTVFVAEIPHRVADQELVDAREAGTVEGRAIAQGEDPRVIDLGGEVLVALRSAREAHPSHHSPLEFYRSTDLETWMPDEALASGITAAENYALGVTRDGLWLATTEQGEEGRMLVSLSRYDTEERRWTKVVEPSAAWGEVRAGGSFPCCDKRQQRDILLLFPTSSSDTYPLELLFTDPEGNLQIRRP